MRLLEVRIEAVGLPDVPQLAVSGGLATEPEPCDVQALVRNWRDLLRLAGDFGQTVFPCGPGMTPQSLDS
ncbi:hypothetical protein GCM10011609_87150 [Lentzea pudingi]|uniref:Uncharacterized protein n=1 Tax=Lentzea pudingi TaxID=1789439 RepID=A0ABQ2IWJ7_9PSEU|nr:hypothetical protein GCM10011609_87150 [Lentzea pudingi]